MLWQRLEHLKPIILGAASLNVHQASSRSLICCLWLPSYRTAVFRAPPPPPPSFRPARLGPPEVIWQLCWQYWHPLWPGWSCRLLATFLAPPPLPLCQEPQLYVPPSERVPGYKTPSGFPGPVPPQPATHPRCLSASGTWRENVHAVAPVQTHGLEGMTWMLFPPCFLCTAPPAAA